MEQNTIFNVKNRSAGAVVYSIPEMGVRREFAPGEIKKISYEELEKLTFISGGRYLMANYLQIDNDTVNEELNIPTELEYYLSEAQIIDLIKTGSLDAWMDALDFAPVGVLDLMKDLSVSVPLTDTRKIQALQEKTGFNVELAIKNNRLDKEAEEVVAKSAPQRRVKPAAAKSERRTTSKYKIVE